LVPAFIAVSVGEVDEGGVEGEVFGVEYQSFG
jgi:hypothetical protein